MIRLLRVGGPYAGWAVLAALLGTLTVAMGVSLMVAGGWLISTASHQGTIGELALGVLAVRVSGTFRPVFRYLERLVTHVATFRLLARLRTWLYTRLEPLAPSHLAHRRSGDVLARLVTDLEAVEQLYARAVHPPAVALGVLAGILLLLGAFSWPMAALVALCLVGAGLGLPLLTRWLGRPLAEDAVRLRAALDTELVDEVQGLGELLVYGRETGQRQRILSLSDGLSRVQRGLARLEGLHQAGTLVLAGTAAAGALVLGTPLVRDGAWEGVWLVGVVLGVLACFEAVTPLPEALSRLDQGRAAAARIFELADQEPPVPAGGDEAKPGALVFSGVHFRYEPDAPKALAGVDLRVEPGRRVAVVGPSGAGKSSLVALALRFWDPSQGRLTLAGADLRGLDPESVRAQLAWVPQGGGLVAGTVRDNLRLADPEADETAMARACEAAGVLSLVESLPLGWDTWIGEHGVRLSGGERQRLALARALLQDRPLVLLDEPTANLDRDTEARVMEAALELTRDKGVLLVTHRLVGLEAMDEVVVLDRGRVVERGTAASLRQAGGLFARLVALQDA